MSTAGKLCRLRWQRAAPPQESPHPAEQCTLNSCRNVREMWQAQSMLPDAVLTSKVADKALAEHWATAMSVLRNATVQERSAGNANTE